MGHTLHIQNLRRKRKLDRKPLVKPAYRPAPNQEATRTFNLRTVLTVTTGRLLTNPTDDGGNGIGDLYDILGWMMMESPFTHQLGRFSDECKPILYRLFPELGCAEACLSRLDKWLEKSPTCPQEGIRMWLTELRMMFPEIKPEYAIPQFPIEHLTHNPMEELAEMVPRERIIQVCAPEPDLWPEEI